jgi:hypothetical protein
MSAVHPKIAGLARGKPAAAKTANTDTGRRMPAPVPGTATGCRALLCRELVFKRGFPMTLGTILIIILILILLGAVPSWPYSRGWGYGPSGIVGIILVILVILVLLGRI